LPAASFAGGGPAKATDAVVSDTPTLTLTDNSAEEREERRFISGLRTAREKTRTGEPGERPGQSLFPERDPCKGRAWERKL
jgi:hypothetical protein